MNKEKEYVLGTHDDEIARLGLQHRVWRPRALDAWRRGGFTTDQTLLDVGCGPGYASVDLAEIVGPSGRIIAIDRSRRFLDALEAVRQQRGLDNITTVEVDLDEGELPAIKADGAWTRWVFAFVKHPHQLLMQVADRLKPGGIFVIHEYLDYSTWRVLPRSSEFEEFVQEVMESWRAEGGEPDIGRELPIWLKELGFELRTLNPIVDVVPASNFVWQWPKAFVQVGLKRLVDLGRITPERALIVSEVVASRETAPHSLIVTPAVIEIVAVRR